MLTQPFPSPAGTRSASAILQLVCGKIGSGKSTLAEQLARQPATVLICEDTWLAGLYPGEISSLSDYVRRAERLKRVMTGHVETLLIAGISVVLDFPCNTVPVRTWARGLFERSGATHRLHFLDVPDRICKARLRARNEAGEHPFATTDAEFDDITGYFRAPSADEGFNVQRYQDNDHFNSRS